MSGGRLPSVLLGFRLYERSHPEGPEGEKGWGAKGELRLERIRQAAGRRSVTPIALVG
jgi:hypothetical protein